MSPKEETPPRLSRSMWLGVMLAAIVSTAALWGGVDSQRRAEGLVIIPFGWNRLIVIHAASTLLLSWGVARVLSRWRPGVTGRSMASVWIIVGLLVAAATVSLGTGSGWIHCARRPFRKAQPGGCQSVECQA